MKTSYYLSLLFFVLAFTNNTNAQSVSASKILNYLENQKQTEISNALIKAGFQSDGKETNYNGTLYSYHKAGTYGLEKFSFGYTEELFSIIYKPASNFYSAMKEKMLTSDFVYSYSYKETKYYENGSMRIGVNDVAKTISFFVILNM